MQIWPAIDLRGGKCVRLQQGDYGRETVFGDDPAQMARHWVSEGARALHLVDLDGARDGRPTNLPSVKSILSAVDVPCELGGGIRDEATAGLLLEAGLARVVIGTRAIADPDWLCRLARAFPDRVVLGIDARNGMVATDGWLETSSVAATELARRFAKEPLAAIIYTDIATDGMLCGPNVAAMKEMRDAVRLPVVASGGVHTADDVRSLAALSLAGCIIGRALYDGKITVRDAIAAAEGERRQTDQLV